MAVTAEKAHGKPILHAIDYMDDGTPIELTVTIDKEKVLGIF